MSTGLEIFPITVPVGDFIARVFKQKNSKRLLGRWGGDVTVVHRTDIKYRVCLGIFECLDRRLDALLYYEGFVDRRLFCRGTDRLIKGAGDKVDKEDSEWKPRFERKAHEWVDFDPAGDQSLKAKSQKHVEYQWRCTITNWSRSASMDIQIRADLGGPSVLVFDGTLLKD